MGAHRQLSHQCGQRGKPAALLECPFLVTLRCLHVKLGRLPFPPPVLDDLRVEGDGPGHKVDPANHLVYDADGVAVDHQEADPWARKE